MKTKKREYDPVKRREYYLRTRKLRGRKRSSKTTTPKSNWVDVLNAGSKKYTDRVHIESIPKDFDWEEDKAQIKEYLKTDGATPDQKKLLEKYLKGVDELIKLETNDSNYDQKKIDEIKVRLSNIMFEYKNTKHLKEHRAAQIKARKENAIRIKETGSLVEDRRRNPSKRVT